MGADDEIESCAGYAPDFLSTLSTRELQAILCRLRTQPLPGLLNRGGVRIDYETRRVWRDSYWKGSFAKDNLMGWEERILTPIRASGPSFAGGRFWKRFDDIRDGRAAGHVVNYGLEFLPGRPSVRQIPYPDDKRRYVRAGDDVLLLTYSNPPYRIVYDLIKVVDENNCIGVMHLGRFPHGLEFATFVMARNNYPFEKMAVPDHDAIFNGDRVRVPTGAELAGSWDGYVVFSRRPEATLHNQFNPRLIRIEFSPAATGVEARVRFGPFVAKKRVQFQTGMISLTGSSSYREEIRAINSDTLIGRRIRNSRPDTAGTRFVLKRRPR